MKNKILTKITLITSIIIGFGASVSASKVQYNTDGIMELPTFYIYASDEAATEEPVLAEQADWVFQKSIDMDAAPVAIEVVLPGEELVKVYTPAIVTALIES